MRTAGSKGPFDLIELWLKTVRLYQLKRTLSCPAARRLVIRLRSQYEIADVVYVHVIHRSKGEEFCVH